MNNECLFCKIVKKEESSKILYEDKDVLVMLDAFPDVEGHTLVIPKKHFTDIYEIPKEELDKMFDVGKEIGEKLMTKLNKKSVTFLINYGDDQAIKHIHLHLLPDYLKRVKNKSREEVFEILTKE